MVFDHFSFARAKKNQEELEKTNPQNPVLNDEDEQFLEKVTSLDHDAPLPPSRTIKDGNDLQGISEAAQSTKLPEQTPAEASQLKLEHRQERTWASYIPTAASLPTVPTLPNMPAMPTMPNMPAMPTWKSKSAAKVDTSTEGYPAGIKVTENVKLDDARREEDEKEVTVLLDRLNLSSINNRVFSFSAQSQKLYSDFTVVLKDLINGVPTAYQDLEKLLKENDAQLRTMFKSMPPFIKTFVMSLLSKLGTSLGPEVFAAASNKPGLDTKTEESKDEKKKKRMLPSIKRLATERGAVAAALRSIVSFLQTRFPAFVTGTNVIMSLAVFVLLFAFWYCHKRGRETRLAKEGEAEAATDDELLEDEEEGEQEEGERVLSDAEIKEILERGSKTADGAGSSAV